jgi:hypothetical protein
MCLVYSSEEDIDIAALRSEDFETMCGCQCHDVTILLLHYFKLQAAAAFHHHVTNQAIASMPSTPRPTGAEGRGSTAPECLQVLRTSAAFHDEMMARMPSCGH